MSYQINKAVVVGAGTMGAAIAAHLANTGVAVTLLDIVPRELTDAEKAKGLTLEDKAVRNRIVQSGLDAALKSKPASFMSADVASLVSIGNLDDDFEVIAEADWVIEVIIENLKIKQGLMARIDEVRGEKTIVSTNTSGIPIASIVEGRSEGFRKHFLGTHFFNPPRYLKLLELIRGEDTLPAVVDFISDFCSRRLGKGIVECKDTPNFIGNRVFAVTGAFAMNYIMEHGYTIPEVEAITGPAIGRPKTATFRLMDLVGIDVAGHVSANLAPLIADDKMAQEALTAEKPAKVSKTMVENGWLGNKTKVGYFKTVRNEEGKKEFWPLNLETLEHEPPGEKVRFDSIGKVRSIEDTGKRIKALIAEEDKAAELARVIMHHSFAYCSVCVPEITDLPSSIDNALCWGFAHEMGPFEIWDVLGVAESIEGMKVDGFEPAAWVLEMLEAGNETFYKYEDGRKIGVYHPEKKQYHLFEDNPLEIKLQVLKKGDGVVKKNDGASLIDMGDGIACLEFHSKMNALDADVIYMMRDALDIVQTDFDGLVIGNEADNFSVGANLFYIVMLSQQEQWDELEEAVQTLQDTMMGIRYSPKPVVIAPAGLALGGGAEVTMSGPRVVSAAELYVGLVELGVGVIPAGTGTKEMIRRVVNPPMRTDDMDAKPLIERLFMQIGLAKVATSAVEAQELGILGPCDRIVMNRDHLLAEAKREARHMADAGYVPPRPEKIYAAGRDVLSFLRVGIYSFDLAGMLTEYDKVVASKLAYVLTGGDISRPQWVSEQYILDLEREAFLSLCGEKRTQERMWHMLQTGKPLRN